MVKGDFMKLHLYKIIDEHGKFFGIAQEKTDQLYIKIIRARTNNGTNPELLDRITEL